MQFSGVKASKMKCPTCSWFEETELYHKIDKKCFALIGTCRKHAPTTNGYPPVFTTDWCGDHRSDGSERVKANGSIDTAELREKYSKQIKGDLQ